MASNANLILSKSPSSKLYKRANNLEFIAEFLQVVVMGVQSAGKVQFQKEESSKEI